MPTIYTVCSSNITMSEYMTFFSHKLKNNHGNNKHCELYLYLNIDDHFKSGNVVYPMNKKVKIVAQEAVIVTC